MYISKEDRENIVKNGLIQIEAICNLMKVFTDGDYDLESKINKYLGYHINGISVNEFWESSSAECW